MNQKFEKVEITLPNQEIKFFIIKDFIEENSDFLKDQYLSFIASLEEKKFLKKKLYEHFDVLKGHNLWEMSLIKEKSFLKSDSIQDIIIFLSLIEIINNYKPKKIVLINFKENIAKNLKKNFNKSEIIISFKNLKKEKNYFIKFLKSFYFILLLKNIYTVFLKLKKDFGTFKYKKKSSDFAIFAYFSHFDLEKYKNNQWYSYQYKELKDIIGKKYSVDEQLIFVKNQITPTFNLVPNQIKTKINFINANLSKLDYLTIYFSFIWYSLKFYFLKKKIFFEKNSIDFYLFNFLKNDYFESFCGSTLIENLLWIKVFENYLFSTSKKKFGVYFMENQAWEKALIKAWKNNNHGELIGYTPTSVNYWHLYYFNKFNQKLKINYINSYFPNTIFVSSKDGYDFLSPQYEKNTKIVKVESLRYNYLLKYINDSAFDANDKKILILGDYDVDINLRLVDIILQSNNCDKNNIYFKPHPGSPKKNKFININYIYEPIEKIINKFSTIITSTSTAASIEFLIIGKKVCIYDDIFSLDLSPVKHYKDFFYRFKNSNEIDNLLLNNSNVEKNKIKFRNYYYLDLNLSMWKNYFRI